MSMFPDERTITLSGGRGGDGSVHWRREKFVAKGGPDGGNGGSGGAVYIEAVRDVRALERYTEGEVLSAGDGMSGSRLLRSGGNGADLVVFVPVGSLITNTETLESFEMLEEGQRVLVAVGGRGGLGNAHFKSSVNTTPRKATSGGVPQSYVFHVELRIIADVGIIGLPNAGKSTLLNTLTNASARVAAYPFTTLEPNIGMFHTYVLADIPGLIERASAGKGLGQKFLKHVSRTRILVHLVSAENEDVVSAYRTVRRELELFDSSLLEKEELVVLSKTDTVPSSAVPGLLSSLSDAVPLTVLDDASVTSFSSLLSRSLGSAR